ncbi:glycogen synthase GlgA [Granulicatella seriolae]|uniref:Glycogen synthase n=1 Tax=Granulicatella seriolae TaxID=2967226 RepID=A0ABT1WL43_9LACT|nr:glycogen synthase GlgA [Granulicatella seriolae]
MRVLFVTGEVAPFYKSGGLGDVAYALPKELVKQGVDIRVVAPYYSSMPERFKDSIQDLYWFTIRVGWKTRYVGVKSLVLDGVTYYFIDNQDYFNRGKLYGEWDDGERFAFFSMAVIEMMEKIDFIPDIIHTNDWHTAMIPALLVDKYHWVEAYKNIRKVITIHNIRFQGIFDSVVLGSLFNTNFALYTDDGVKYNGGTINYLKGGINFSDRVTTVSPSYAKEIQTPEFGEGLDGVLRHNSWKLHGILNGIDYDINNPQTDDLIPYHFSINDLSGKEKNKLALQEWLDLPQNADIPLISCVSRLTDQKGFHLVQEKLNELLQQDVQVVILGSGEAEFEHSFRYFADVYPDKCKTIIDFNVQLAQEIYAASDMFLMPSAFEPCGLSQLISLRYGTLPLVHETGGLRDTVQPYNVFTGEGDGFSFYDFNSQAMMDTIYRALEVYHQHPQEWQKMMHQAMTRDYSWEKPAAQYKQLYTELLNG